MDVVGRTVRIRARGHEPSRACPGCGMVSTRVHSRYERKISDTAISNQQALIHLQVRRFFCDSAGCERRTFVEQMPWSGATAEAFGGGGRVPRRG
ncbi:transposase family protein [Streptomyces sp. NPDC005522]